MSERIPHHGVVLGVDGSALAGEAAKWAAHEAVMRHVPLTVVHVVSPLAATASPLAWPAGGVPEEIIEIQTDESRRIVADAVKAIKDGVAGAEQAEIHGESIFGGTVPTLVHLSKQAQLVVVGASGRGHERHRRLLGSVSTGLIHHAHGPVAIVHNGAPSSHDTTRLPVVVGVDGSRASEVAVALAFDEASRRGVDLVALHVWSDADMSTVPGIEVSALKLGADKALAESLAGWQERYPDVTIHRVVEFEGPVRHLVDRAKMAQLLVVGSHGRGGFAGMLLGSVSTAVVQEACVPVIVARQA